MTSSSDQASEVPEQAPTVRHHWWVLALILLPSPLLILHSAAEETFYRFWIYTFTPLFALIGAGFWWSLISGFSKGARLRRSLYLLGTLGVSFAIIASVARLEPSASGTSVPRLAWRWSDSSDPKGTPQVSEAPDTSLPIAPPRSLAGANDMPGFLGPQRNAKIPGIHLEPDWTESPPQEVWRKPIGPGWASFAVAGRHAITLEQREEGEAIVCFDLETGSVIWNHLTPSHHFKEPMGGAGPRSTPAIYQNSVYALGATGTLKALKINDGALLWERNILEDATSPNLEYGTTSSPLILPQESTVVVSGGKKGAELLAYHLGDGALAWKTGAQGGSYSSPRLVHFAEKRSLLTVHKEGIAAYDPADGSKLWEFLWGNKLPKVAQPQLVDENQFLVSGSYGHGTHLVNVVPKGEGFQITPVWESRRMKTKFSSPSVIGNYAYGLDEGMFACIDLETGDRVWKDGRYGFGQHLEVGTHLLLLSERGSLVLMTPSPDRHIESARFEVFSKKCWSARCLAGAYCLLRSETEVACLLLPTKSSPSNTNDPLQ